MNPNTIQRAYKINRLTINVSNSSQPSWDLLKKMDNTVVFPHNFHLRLIDTRNLASYYLLNESLFIIISMDIKYGYIITGSNCGLLKSINLENHTSVLRKAYTGVVRSINIYKNDKEVRFLTAHIKKYINIYRAEGALLISTIRLQMVVYRLTISPLEDFVLILLRHDCIYKYPIEDKTLRKLCVYKGPFGSAISIAIHRNGDLFAVADENGEVSLYSAGRTEPICTYESSVLNFDNHITKMKFVSTNNLDYLFVSYRMDYLRIIDIRNLTVGDNIKLESNKNNIRIFGFTFDKETKNVYIGTDKYLYKLKMNESIRRMNPEYKLA